MVLIDLQSVLGALGLVSSIAKPLPVAGPILGGLIGTVGGVVNSTLPAATGPLNGLLPGLVGAVNVTPNKDGSVRASDSSGGETTTFDSASSSSDPSFTAADQGGDPCAMSPYSPPQPVYLDSFAPYDANQALIYRYRQQQSVNLGSWFVQEQWMVPSLFTCAAGNKQAELDVANGWGSVDNARQVLEKHWDTWITEDDFAYLASIGINTVRLPIGYWSLGPTYCQGTPFEPVAAAYVNSWARVVRAINWAEKYGLGILVDLHGAPGSQNGQGHSGTSDGIQNLFDNPTNVQLTMNVLTYLVQQLVKVNNVVGIQILNEPNNVDGLPAFYSNAITKLRQVAPEAASFPFYIHDGFDLGRFADYISTRNDFVVVDHHSYFVFGDANDQKRPASDLVTSLQPAKGSLSEQLLGAAAEGRRNMVVDEWSCALSQAALEGSSDPTAARQKFCTGQMESYTNATAGWSFWSYKTESCDSDVNWCFKSAVGNSLPTSFFSYPAAAIKHISEIMSSDSSAASADTTYLTFGIPITGSDVQTDGYTPPTEADWQAAMGASAPQWAGITEALAHTEYDDLETNSQESSDVTEGGEGSSLPLVSEPTASATPSASASASATPSSTVPSSAASPSTSTTPLDLYPPPAAEPVAEEQFPFVAGFMRPAAMSASVDPTINTATIPSSRMQMADVKRRALGYLPQRAFLLASDLRKHRFAARHLRHAALAIQNAKRQEPSAQPDANATPQQKAITRGYSDGWRAAKTFAAANGSRLGFSGQFISDALTALGSEVMSGDAAYYRTWFLKGLADGEVQVLKSKALDSQGPSLAAR